MGRHVLFVTAWYPDLLSPINGIAFRDQALALKNYGHKIGVISPRQVSLKQYFDKNIYFRSGLSEYLDEEIPTYRYYHWGWLPKIPYGNTSLWIRFGIKLFKRYVKRHGMPEIIHAYSVMMGGILAVELKKRYGIPVLLRENGNVFDTDHYKFPFWYDKLVRNALSQMNKITTVSSELAELMYDRYSLNHNSVERILNPVDSVFFEESLVARKSKKDDFTFFAAGNLETNKGHADLIEAFSLGFLGRPGVHLRIAGNGPNKDKLLDQCERLGVKDQVTFLGRADRKILAREMVQCGTFILPSRYETYGNVVAEALSCGTPVITTRCLGPQSFVNNNCGIVVPAGDPKSMSEAMIKMTETASQYNSEEIRRYSQSLFSKDNICKRISEIYEEVINST